MLKEFLKSLLLLTGRAHEPDPHCPFNCDPCHVDPRVSPRSLFPNRLRRSAVPIRTVPAPAQHRPHRGQARPDWVRSTTSRGSTQLSRPLHQSSSGFPLAAMPVHACWPPSLVLFRRSVDKKRSDKATARLAHPPTCVARATPPASPCLACSWAIGPTHRCCYAA
jgi:hypothetical protein